MKKYLLLLMYFISSNHLYKVYSQAISDRNNAIKMDIIPNNYLLIGYEHKLNSFTTIEITPGLIGIGQGTNWPHYKYVAEGGLLKLAHKKVVLKKFIKSSNSFKGIYYKPEIAFAFFNETRTGDNLDGFGMKVISSFRYENTVQAFSILMKIGYQQPILKRILVDFYCGFGTCFDNRSREYDYRGTENNFIARRYYEGNRFSIAGGISIGYLFTTAKKQKD